jgi:hypothetical protein
VVNLAVAVLEKVVVLSVVGPKVVVLVQVVREVKARTAIKARKSTMDSRLL